MNDPDNPKVYDDPLAADLATKKMSEADMTREHAEIVCCADATYTNVDNLLIKANGCGLLYEVVWFALWHMKKNPDLVIEDALELGFHEWVK